jgi:hypothetical protein
MAHSVVIFAIFVIVVIVVIFVIVVVVGGSLFNLSTGRN